LESIRSAAPPMGASFSSGYPSSTLIELKPYGSKNCLANFWIPTWRVPSEGRFRESDPCRRRRVSRLAAVALPLLGGPCCRVAALPSRRARECAVIRRCAVTTCGPPVPDPNGSCRHPLPMHTFPGGERRRRAAARGYTHISNLRWNTCRTRRVACVILNAYLPPTLCADLDTDQHLGFWGIPVYDHNGLRGEMGRGRGE
jgi:hypothetical protein